DHQEKQRERGDRPRAGHEQSDGAGELRRTDEVDHPQRNAPCREELHGEEEVGQFQKCARKKHQAHEHGDLLQLMIRRGRSPRSKQKKVCWIGDQARGCGTQPRYGRGPPQPFGYCFFASSSETEPAMITSSPGCQFTGVETLWLAVSYAARHLAHLNEIDAAVAL